MLAVAALTAFGLASCVSAPVPAGSLQGAWDLALVDGEPAVGDGARPITMDLGSTSVRGEAPCNSYGGTYKIDDGRLDLDVIITVAGCVSRRPSRVNIRDNEFIETLHGGQLRLASASRLVVSGEGRILTFKRATGRTAL